MNCWQCNGHGFYGGHMGTDHDSPWTACGLCERGQLGSTQALVDKSNEARDKLIKRFGARSLESILSERERSTPADVFRRLSNVAGEPTADTYQGEF